MNETSSTGKKPNEISDSVTSAKQRLIDPDDCDHSSLSEYAASVDANGRLETFCPDCGARLAANVTEHVDWTVTGVMPGWFDE